MKMKKLLVSLLVSASVSGFAMAEGDPEKGESQAASCFGCHGMDGNSTAPSFPKLAGQSETYLVKQLSDIKSGRRESAVMAGFAAGLTPEMMANISAFYASKEVSSGTTDPDKAELGERIYKAGLPAKGVAACGACHGPNGQGTGLAGFPALKGQYAAYVEGQLKAFAQGTRNNDPSNMMGDIASKMGPEDMAAVASYVEGMK